MKRFAIALAAFLMLVTSAQAFGQAANVITFGADPTGTSDSTAAFASAAASSNDVFAPCGTYLINWTVSSKVNFKFSGAGYCTYLEPYASGVDAITVTGGNFSAFENFQLVNRGVTTGGNGITITQRQGNTRLVHISASGFGVNGVNVVGGAADPDQLSGIDVIDGFFLNNGNAGISYIYANDFHVAGNSIGHNTRYGIYQSNSNAGQVTGNFVWQNGVGVFANASHYDWWSNNRLTQSNSQGFFCTTCYYSTVTNNQTYQNNDSTPYTAEIWKFVDSNGLIFTGNNSFEWNSSHHSNYGLTIDGSSRNATISNNQFSSYLISAANIDPSAQGIMLRNNLPASDITVNNCASGGFLSGNSGSVAVGGAGTTIYLGGSQSTNENQTTFPVSTAANVCAFSVFVGSAPGAGQSYTFTLRKNGVSTGITGSISGPGAFAANVLLPASAISVAQGDALDIMMVSSAGAPATNTRYSVTVAAQ